MQEINSSSLLGSDMIVRQCNPNILDNQHGRRNLSKADSILLAQKKAEILAERAKENQAKYYGNQYDKSTFIKTDKSPNSINVRNEIAKNAGVSTGTVA